jgi:hypothetical protein
MPTSRPSAGAVESLFLAHLSRVAAHARFAFRRVACPHARADLEAEAVALAWSRFADLALRGRRPERFVTTLALRCTQAVRAGRRLAGCEGARDVLSPVARARHGFGLVGLPGRADLPAGMAEVLADNTRSPVPDQAAFRLDFGRWRAALGRRDWAVLDALAAGERPADVARRFRISKGRVSQLRSEFELSWGLFEDDGRGAAGHDRAGCRSH